MILVSRALSLFLSCIAGFIGWAILAFPALVFLNIGWQYWDWPGRTLFQSQPAELWVVFGYGLSLLILLLVPGLRMAYFDFVTGYRKPSDREKAILEQIQSELAWRCRSRKINLPKIKWRVATQSQVNGFAYGRNYICLTQTLLRKARKSGDKWHGAAVGLAAHELGHLYYGDGIISLWLSMFIWPLNLMIRIAWVLSHTNVSIVVLRRFLVSLGFVFLLFRVVGVLLLHVAFLPYRLTLTRMEYRADKFAYFLGLGKERVFQLEHHLGYEDNRANGWQQLVDTHPPSEFRIQAYERWMIEGKDKPVLKTPDAEFVAT